MQSATSVACNLGSKGKPEGAFTNPSFQLDLALTIHWYDAKLMADLSVVSLHLNLLPIYVGGEMVITKLLVFLYLCACVLKRHCKVGTKLFFVCAQTLVNAVASQPCMDVIRARWPEEGK